MVATPRRHEEVAKMKDCRRLRALEGTNSEQLGAIRTIERATASRVVACVTAASRFDEWGSVSSSGLRRMHSNTNWVAAATRGQRHVGSLTPRSIHGSNIVKSARPTGTGGRETR